MLEISRDINIEKLLFWNLSYIWRLFWKCIMCNLEKLVLQDYKCLGGCLPKFPVDIDGNFHN